KLSKQKQPIHRQVHSNQNKPETNKQTPKPASKKTTSCPQTGKCGHNKKQQTKTTKHTIEFSNNTPRRPRNQPAAKSR
ncbi:MAG: hypothetical protein WBB00_20095, partial [Mycobacterium sp.]